MTKRAKPLRWRNEKSDRHGAPNCRGLYRDGTLLATAQQQRDGKWFWYGQGRNSSNRPTTLGAVEIEASAHIRELGL